MPGRGLLTEKAAPVMNIIHSVFSLVRKFRSQLISQPWGPAGGPRGSEHPNFALMQQSYHAFKYYSHFLFKGEAPPARGAGRGGAGRSECLPSPSGDQAGEPRLPATSGGLSAAHQLQQLLPGRLKPTAEVEDPRDPSDHMHGSLGAAGLLGAGHSSARQGRAL